MGQIVMGYYSRAVSWSHPGRTFRVFLVLLLYGWCWVGSGIGFRNGHFENRSLEKNSTEHLDGKVLFYAIMVPSTPGCFTVVQDIAAMFVTN